MKERVLQEPVLGDLKFSINRGFSGEKSGRGGGSSQLRHFHVTDRIQKRTNMLKIYVYVEILAIN